MSRELFYLRQDIQVEPLVDRWYAWSHLIAPATAARNLTERHMKIMESYISAPQIHMNAVRNPEMLGGPFVDYCGNRVAEIKALMDHSKTRRANLFKLSQVLGELDSLLRTIAKGQSLIPLYAQVPDALKGYVELAYDLNHQPAFRIIEPLLYKSVFYDRTAQSLMLSVIRGDERPFILSTPRLDAEDCVSLKVPFDDESVDALFQAKTQPTEIESVLERTHTRDNERALFRAFFTPTAPLPYQRYDGQGVRWRYFGHACILIETKDATLLFDPVLSYTYESDISRYTYLDLPEKIDYVLITHNHQDHVLLETLLQIRHKVKNVIVPRNGGGSLQDPSLKLVLENIGFRNVRELAELESIDFANGQVMALPFLGEHSDLDIRTKLAYLIRIGGHSLLFAADSCNLEPLLYEHLHREFGDIEVLFLGMECDGAPLSWVYGPLFFRPLERSINESRRLSGSDYHQALDIVSRLGCKQVYVYAMGQEPWLNYVMSLKYTEVSRPIVHSNRLIQSCRERGIEAERLFGEKEILLEGLLS